MTYQPQLDWIKTQHAEMVKRTDSWSRINSGSYHVAGVSAMCDTLKDAFAVLGGEASVEQLAPMESINSKGEKQAIPVGPLLRIRKRPNAKKQVLLGGHMDTVFPKEHAFQTPRMIDDDTMNGPGVADLKGGLSVMLTALQAFEQNPHAANLGWEIILNPDEEIGSYSSAAHWVDAAKRHDFGLIYEPALPDGSFAGARKGSGNFTAVMRGRAAHAGRNPQDGRNAIAALAEFTTMLFALNSKRAGVTVNPAIVNGGTATNIVPDLAMLKFNIRIGEPTDQFWVESELRAIAEYFVHKDGFTLELHGGFGRPPKILSAANSALFEQLEICGQSVGMPVRWVATGGCCDGNNLAAAGLPNVDSMGVEGGMIHTDQEFVKIDSFVRRAQLSALMLMRYAAGEFTIR